MQSTQEKKIFCISFFPHAVKINGVKCYSDINIPPPKKDTLGKHEGDDRWQTLNLLVNYLFKNLITSKYWHYIVCLQNTSLLCNTSVKKQLACSLFAYAFTLDLNSPCINISYSVANQQMEV